MRRRREDRDRGSASAPASARGPARGLDRRRHRGRRRRRKRPAGRGRGAGPSVRRGLVAGRVTPRLPRLAHGSQRQRRDLRLVRERDRGAQPDLEPVERVVAGLVARRRADRLCLRPRRRAADLRDGCRRLRRPACHRHLGRVPGLVAGRDADRLRLSRGRGRSARGSELRRLRRQRGRERPPAADREPRLRHVPDVVTGRDADRVPFHALDAGELRAAGTRPRTDSRLRRFRRPGGRRRGAQPLTRRGAAAEVPRLVARRPLARRRRRGLGDLRADGRVGASRPAGGFSGASPPGRRARRRTSSRPRRAPARGRPRGRRPTRSRRRAGSGCRALRRASPPSRRGSSAPAPR